MKDRAMPSTTCRRNLSPKPVAHVRALARRHHTPWPKLDLHQAPFNTYSDHLAASDSYSALPRLHSHERPRLSQRTCDPPSAPLPRQNRYLIARSLAQTTYDTARTLRTINHKSSDTTATMSGWGLGWFGGGQAKKEAPKKAILQLRGQLEMLNKREKHLQNQMDEQDTIARKYVSSNKNGMSPLS